MLAQQMSAHTAVPSAILHGNSFLLHVLLVVS